MNEKKASLKKAFFLHFEWLILTAGLLLMAMTDPAAEAKSFCILQRLGADFCPGCGLGRSVAYLFQGDLQASVQMHPAGLPAVLILTGRITTLFHRNHKYKKEETHEKDI